MDSLLCFSNLLYRVSEESKDRLEKTQKKFPFSLNEDKLLVLLVNKYGKKSWAKISSYFPDRSARQCRERFNIYLSPDIRHDDWTPNEDELLQELVETHGKKWAEIALSFQGRTANSVKNRYYVHILKTRRKSHKKNVKNIMCKTSTNKTKKSGKNQKDVEVKNEEELQSYIDDIYGLDISFEDFLSTNETTFATDYFDI